MTSIYPKVALAIAGTVLNLPAIAVNSVQSATFLFFLTETPCDFLPVRGTIVMQVNSYDLRLVKS